MNTFLTHSVSRRPAISGAFDLILHGPFLLTNHSPFTFLLCHNKHGVVMFLEAEQHTNAVMCRFCQPLFVATCSSPHLTQGSRPYYHKIMERASPIIVVDVPLVKIYKTEYRLQGSVQEIQSFLSCFGGCGSPAFNRLRLSSYKVPVPPLKNCLTLL